MYHNLYFTWHPHLFSTWHRYFTEHLISFWRLKDNDKNKKILWISHLYEKIVHFTNVRIFIYVYWKSGKRAFLPKLHYIDKPKNTDVLLFKDDLKWPREAMLFPRYFCFRNFTAFVIPILLKIFDFFCYTYYSHQSYWLFGSSSCIS